ncbi:Duplicated homeodomain-like superfamily protein [Forsythia ovata]|uniref:Duplicated homeodomain-like superfamily protein n=1 Tax=Forsythia ovata TaxID=205694 RepID=A0ABD1WGB8_9LAMI
METLSWLMQQRKSTIWTREENKKFERALVIFDEKTPYRWHKVADMIPGKSVIDVINQYRKLVADISDIEAGLVPIPGYLAASFTFEENSDFDAYRKRGRSYDQERKKGVPWTEEEHRRFLLGLERHGKGDWRNISRNFVISKTPTQVASHAQKYFLRQLSGGKDKRRPSIHDITTWSESVDKTPNSIATPNKLLDWNNKNDSDLMVFDSIAYPQDMARFHGRAGSNICSRY